MPRSTSDIGRIEEGPPGGPIGEGGDEEEEPKVHHPKGGYRDGTTMRSEEIFGVLKFDRRGR